MTGLPYTRLRVAIVGLGRSGAYAAGHLLSDAGLDVQVDVFEKLPTPPGLAGARIAPRFNYFGNVELGRDINRQDLLARYHAVIYAVGTRPEAPASIPGEELLGSAPATSFAGWYHGHPEHRDERFDLASRRAVVVGTGDLALQVAGMLARGPQGPAHAELPDHVIQALDRSRIEEVVVLGRRGPEQAACSNSELRDLGALAGVDVVADPVEVAVPPPFREPAPSRTAQRNLALLREFAARPRTGRPRIALRFLLSPTRILGDGRVQAIELMRNTLERDAERALRARPTGARATIPTGLVLRAGGSRGPAVPGVPFDERRGIIPNDRGRIVGADGRPTREYVVGSAKRGPGGVTGTEPESAAETIAALLQDLVGDRRPIAVA